uniref:Uncharacterized protein At4g02000 family n=1 Tax=Cajanus cajan TaxID=3821 RepID=A0A151TP48_CAJCA|nr:Uncharacterized protein At4g02000 family [Cajanus cajan]
MDSLEEDLEGLIIKDDDVGGTSNLVNLSLVGRFLSDRPIRTHIMKNRMASIWHPGKGVSISELKPGVFLFQFYHPLDLKRILDNGPWNFENNILIVSKIFEGDIPKDTPLNHIDVWVQVHNLPVGFMSQSIGVHLGNSLGKFLEYDSKHNTSLWKSYMRIHIKIDIRSPLQKENKIKKQGGEWKTVIFKYEKIGQLCYLCSILGHNDKFCPKLFEKEDDDGIRLWGPELRAGIRQIPSFGGEQWLREDNITTNDNYKYQDNNHETTDPTNDSHPHDNEVIIGADKKRRRHEPSINPEHQKDFIQADMVDSNEVNNLTFLTAVPGTQGCQDL